MSKIIAAVKFTIFIVPLIGLALSMSLSAAAQTGNASPDTALTLDQCIAYALKNQPSINQAQINVSITKLTNSINLAGWLPQANASANLTHYLTLPTSFVNNNGQVVQQRTGVINSAVPVLSVTQTIFNP